MTTGPGDRTPGVPRFDAALRGYNRVQVDEYVARVQRVFARIQADAEAQVRRPAAGPQPLPAPQGAPRPAPYPQPSPRPRPGPHPAPPGMNSPGMNPAGIDPPGTNGVPGAGASPAVAFSERMAAILRVAEEEAREIRARARIDAEAERAAVRVELETLTRERDEARAEVERLRSRDGRAGVDLVKPAAEQEQAQPDPPAEEAPAENPTAGEPQVPKPAGDPARSADEATVVVPRPKSADDPVAGANVDVDDRTVLTTAGAGRAPSGGTGRNGKRR